MTTISQTPAILPGHFPPFATITPTDHSAWILVAASLGLVCTLVFGGLRALVRGRNSGSDDHVLTLATGLAIIQSSLVLGACANGFGKAFHLTSEDHQARFQQLYYASNILATVILGLSKLSVPLILLRMSPVTHHKVTFYITIGSLVTAVVGSALTTALQCGPTMPWLYMEKTCPERWRVILALDILTEIWVMGLPVYVVWGLQTTLARKGLVVGAFATRTAIVVAICFRLSAYDPDAWTTDPSLLQAPFAVWTQSEMNLSIICTTATGLQKYLKDFDTHFGGLSPNDSSYADGTRYGGSSGNQNSHGYEMTGMRTAATDTEQRHVKGTDGRFDKALAREGQSKWAPTGDNSSINSSGSRQMIIRKDVSWTVVSDN